MTVIAIGRNLGQWFNEGSGQNYALFHDLRILYNGLRFMLLLGIGISLHISKLKILTAVLLRI